MTRRCSERRFFLTPSRTTNAVFLYVLAVAAQRYGVLVHAFCVLSNHCHLVVTDRRGNLPAFMQYLDALVARAVNAHLGRFEAFWATDGSYSAVEPLDPGDVVAKTAYVLANPVAAGLVRRSAEWPGLRSSAEQMGSSVVARRPRHFFDPRGSLPDAVELEISFPLGTSQAEFRSRVSADLRELEGQHRREIEAAGRRFLGVERVLSQSPFARPPGGERRFGLKPRIAARDRWKRMEGIRRLKAFLEAYRQAWLDRKAGVENVLFPVGTYLLRILHGVQCASTA